MMAERLHVISEMVSKSKEIDTEGFTVLVLTLGAIAVSMVGIAIIARVT